MENSAEPPLFRLITSRRSAAAESDDTAQVKRWLAKVADVNAFGPNGKTALQLACEAGNTGAAKVGEAKLLQWSSKRFQIEPLCPSQIWLCVGGLPEKRGARVARGRRAG